MYEELKVTPEFEHHRVDADNNEVCPVWVEMKSWTKEWTIARVNYVKDAQGTVTINQLDSFVDPTSTKDYVTEFITELHKLIALEISKEKDVAALIPLKEFICDTCGEPITIDDYPVLECSIHEKISSDNSYFEALYKVHIVHQQPDCLYADAREVLMIPIDNEFLSQDQFSIAYGLMELSDSKVMNAELLEISKRLTIPYYEEARLHLDLIESRKSQLDFSTQRYNRHFLRNIVLDNY